MNDVVKILCVGDNVPDLSCLSGSIFTCLLPGGAVDSDKILHCLYDLHPDLIILDCDRPDLSYAASLREVLFVNALSPALLILTHRPDHPDLSTLPQAPLLYAIDRLVDREILCDRIEKILAVRKITCSEDFPIAPDHHLVKLYWRLVTGRISTWLRKLFRKNTRSPAPETAKR